MSEGADFKNVLNDNFTSAADIAYTAFRDIEGDVAEQKNAKCIPTGFIEMDKELEGGIYDTDLIVLAGRPYIGITTLALNILNNVACVGQKTVVYFSFGDDKGSLMKRLLGIMAEVNIGHFGEKNNLGEWEWKCLVDAVEAVQKSKFYFFDIPVSNLTDLIKNIKFAKENLGAELVIIDNLNLIPQNPKNRQEYSFIADKLKDTILDLRLPVILLAQLKIVRFFDDRDNAYPQIKELSRFGSLVEKSDMITFLYNRSYYTYLEEEANTYEWIIARNKRGVAKTINLFYKHKTCKFKSIPRYAE